MRFSDVAKLISEVFGETISHDGSKEAFFTAYAHLGDTHQAVWDLFEYERDNEVVWARNDFAECMLGRKPTTVRAWLQAHRQELFT
ncbi:hypothetical protein [Mycobacterium sp. 1465703.0]|uniref:hypothetical protein n=1 Tax=Mycobacterium sp. 1465703.0 TaxID=1834078 RepID=UPI0007FDDDF5|nr:hypothetical protein [Mycobacterium sp. 1465703.0]OBJ10910.1 hypothetical protein A5625_10615 [Mycobacterium sp. 1465703.0]